MIRSPRSWEGTDFCFPLKIAKSRSYSTAAYNAGPPRAPIPCRGLNIEFDRYCDRVLDNVDPREDDTGEMRR
jgi:hypothetical protein